MSRYSFPGAALPALALTLAACADHTTPTGPAATPRATASLAAATGNVIAFTSYRDGNGEIYAMAPDGSGATRLTNHAAIDLSPVWSPDGSKIAFVSHRDGSANIYVMNADGSGQTRLTSDPGIDASPAWSPDGSKIAYWNVPSGPGSYDLYVINADGTGQTRLTSTADAAEFDPAWSPDGTRIVYTRITSTPATSIVDLWVMNADGSGQAPLLTAPGSEFAPSWSPDGSKIAFHSNRDELSIGKDAIFVVNADGTGQTRLTNMAVTAAHPAWSADGTRIVFGAGGEGAWQVYVMSADGTGVTQLTNEGRNLLPSWRPSGVVLKPQAIKFTSAPPTPGLVGDAYQVSATGGASGNPVTLTSLTPNVCTVGAGAANAAAVALVAVGTCTMAADQAGGAGYTAAPRATQSFAVAKRTQAISFTSTPPAPALLGAQYTVSAVGGGSGNPVALTSLTPAVCVVSAGATSPAAVDFVAVGACAVAADQAGTAAYEPAPRAIQQIAVQYAFGGFAAPIENAPVVNTLRAGRGIPIRFALGGDRGLAIFRPGFPRFVSAPCGASDPQAPVEVSTDSPSGLTYDPTTGLYTYVWKSDAALAGRCGRFELGLVDSSDHGALFQFR